MVALPPPEPVQLPLVVMATGRLDVVAAFTKKMLLNDALLGAAIITVMSWPALPTVVDEVTSGAALKSPLPVWF